MRKIPTVFERVYENHKVVGIKPDITPGCEEAFLYGTATVKVDGSCCAMIDGIFYRRYDAKKGKKPPKGAIPCCEPDIITGHHPHWVMVNQDDPSDKWFVEAFNNTSDIHHDAGCRTYEAVGPHFQRNPYELKRDCLKEHGAQTISVKRTFEDIREYLRTHNQEGIVFWANNEPVCKIKRTDFGFKWPTK